MKARPLPRARFLIPANPRGIGAHPDKPCGHCGMAVRSGEAAALTDEVPMRLNHRHCVQPEETT